MNTLALDHVNKRAEFVMSFTIPFKAVEDPTSQAKCYSPHAFEYAIHIEGVRTVTETFENGTLARKRFNELKKKP